jgi:hypothetical protein
MFAPPSANGANRIHEVARTAGAKHTIGNAALPKLAHRDLASRIHVRNAAESGQKRTDANVESPGGISPPGAPKTVREPLDSHGSRCSTVGTRATGFTSSTGSSCCQMASVGPWPRLNNAAPSVQPHYKAFIPTTGHSAPVLRIGTLVLAVVAA